MKIMLLILSIFIISNISFAEDINFKEEILKKIDSLHNQNNKKIKLVNDENCLIYAIVPNNPVSRGGVLLKVLEAGKKVVLLKGESSPIIKTFEKEYTYSYKLLDREVYVSEKRIKEKTSLYICFLKGRALQEDENRAPYRDDTIMNKDIKIPLEGESKSGTLTLFFIDDFDDKLVNSYGDYYISFKLVEPDRILVEIKK